MSCFFFYLCHAHPARPPVTNFFSCSPAVTSYPGPASFPPLAQSTVYSAFPQTGQTYGLPPFGQSSLFRHSINPVHSLSASRHQHHRNFCFEGPHCAWEPLARFSCNRWRATSSVNSAPPRPTLPSCCHCFFFFILRLPLLSFLYSFFSSSGALWPGIKTETGLPEAPSGGQPGFLSFSTAYTSSQQGHLHYSYPNQGKLRPHPASQNNTAQLPPVESRLFHSFVIFGKHFSSFFFFFSYLAAASTA